MIGDERTFYFSGIHMQSDGVYRVFAIFAGAVWHMGTWFDNRDYCSYRQMSAALALPRVLATYPLEGTKESLSIFLIYQETLRNASINRPANFSIALNSMHQGRWDYIIVLLICSES